MKKTLASLSVILLVLVFAVPILGITDGESRIIKAIKDCCSVSGPLPTGASSSDNQTSGAQKTQVVDSGAEAATVTGERLDVNATATAASAFTTLQLPSAITATLVKAADTDRKRLLIRNLDSAITIYVGGVAVTILTGMQVKAGESIAIYSTAAVYSVSASGTPLLAYLDETD